jgi:hypothetical protein
LVLDKVIIDYTNVYLHGEKNELIYAFAYDFDKIWICSYGLNGNHKPLSHFSSMFFTHVLTRESTILGPCSTLPPIALPLENP